MVSLVESTFVTPPGWRLLHSWGQHRNLHYRKARVKHLFHSCFSVGSLHLPPVRSQVPIRFETTYAFLLDWVLRLLAGLSASRKLVSNRWRVLEIDQLSHSCETVCWIRYHFYVLILSHRGSVPPRRLDFSLFCWLCCVHASLLCCCFPIGY